MPKHDCITFLGCLEQNGVEIVFLRDEGEEKRLPMSGCATGEKIP